MSSVKSAKSSESVIYAVIFTSRRVMSSASGDLAPAEDGYAAAAERMAELVRAQPGFLGMDSARGADGFGITVCYWDSLEAIAAWKANAEHEAARERGRWVWYEAYDLRVAKVERHYGSAIDGDGRIDRSR